MSARVAGIKAGFTRRWLAHGGRETHQSFGRERQGHCGVWQRRFRAPLIRDETALAECRDDVHDNPVQHGHAHRPHAWPFSGVRRHVGPNHSPADWLCICDDRTDETHRGSRPAPPRDVPGVEAD